MHKIEDLKIWHKSIVLAKSVYELVAGLPPDEKYGLTSQMKRSVISISSNIAEGAGRNSDNEFTYFLSIANGSAYELYTQLILTIELKLIPLSDIQPILDAITEIQKMNYSLQKKLKNNVIQNNSK
jgi:four helix bundle protein